MDVLWKNLVYSARMLLKRPNLTAVAIIARRIHDTLTALTH